MFYKSAFSSFVITSSHSHSRFIIYLQLRQDYIDHAEKSKAYVPATDSGHHKQIALLLSFLIDGKTLWFDEVKELRFRRSMEIEWKEIQERGMGGDEDSGGTKSESGEEVLGASGGEGGSAEDLEECI